MKKKKVNIILATGIYPPDIGGPATYAKALKEKFFEHGIGVKILTYGEADSTEDIIYISRNQNTILRYVKYFWNLWGLRKWVDVVYAFDQISTGIPCSLFKLFQPQKKFILRLGGDFLWEKAYNSGWTKATLSDYYKYGKNLKEKLFIAIYGFVYGRCDRIIFSTKWYKNICLKSFGFVEKKSIYIENAFPEVVREKMVEVKNKQILVVGRLIGLKNIGLILKIASKKSDYNFLIVGNGPEKANIEQEVVNSGISSRVKITSAVPHLEVFRLIQESWLVIVPAISEISPNTVLEAVKLNKPVISTRECGFPDIYGDGIMFFDPRDELELERKIDALSVEDNYNEYIEKLKTVDSSRDWNEVANDHMNLFEQFNTE